MNEIYMIFSRRNGSSNAEIAYDGTAFGCHGYLTRDRALDGLFACVEKAIWYWVDEMHVDPAGVAYSFDREYGVVKLGEGEFFIRKLEPGFELECTPAGVSNAWTNFIRESDEECANLVPVCDRLFADRESAESSKGCHEDAVAEKLQICFPQEMDVNWAIEQLEKLHDKENW